VYTARAQKNAEKNARPQGKTSPRNPWGKKAPNRDKGSTRKKPGYLLNSRRKKKLGQIWGAEKKWSFGPNRFGKITKTPLFLNKTPLSVVLAQKKI